MRPRSRSRPTRRPRRRRRRRNFATCSPVTWPGARRRRIGRRSGAATSAGTGRRRATGSAGTGGRRRSSARRRRRWTTPSVTPTATASRRGSVRRPGRGIRGGSGCTNCTGTTRACCTSPAGRPPAPVELEQQRALLPHPSRGTGPVGGRRRPRRPAPAHRLLLQQGRPQGAQPHAGLPDRTADAVLQGVGGGRRHAQPAAGGDFREDRRAGVRAGETFLGRRAPAVRRPGAGAIPAAALPERQLQRGGERPVPRSALRRTGRRGVDAGIPGEGGFLPPGAAGRI